MYLIRTKRMRTQEKTSKRQLRKSQLRNLSQVWDIYEPASLDERPSQAARHRNLTGENVRCLKDREPESGAQGPKKNRQ